MISATTMEKTKTLTAQEKWAVSDHNFRGQMLDLIGWSRCFATTSWKKLPHMVKVNLQNKPWTE